MSSQKFASIRRAALVSLWLLAPIVLALPDDAEQQIEIRADGLELDVKKGTTTYRGAVRLSQGSLIVTADQLTVEYEDDEPVKIIAVGEGKPASYQQTPRVEEPPLIATAMVITYSTRDRRVELRGNAQLSRARDHLSGNVIEYDMAAQKVVVSRGTDPVRVDLNPTKKNRE